MILGIDTSTEFLSLALQDQHGKQFVYHEKQDRKHGEVMVPAIQGLLKQAEVKMDSLTGIAVGIGPGSFTGVRVGVASACGIAQALSIPIVGISSFAIIAGSYSKNQVLVCSDARRDMMYAALYDVLDSKVTVLFEEKLTDLVSLKLFVFEKDTILCGPDAKLYYDSLKISSPSLLLANEMYLYPKAEVLIRLAEPALRTGGMAWDKIQPIYLRKTQAEEMILQKNK